MYIEKRPTLPDIFNAFLVAGATFVRPFEIPAIKISKLIPNKLISFSRALRATDYNQWVHFFEYDYLFERLWKNPSKYLELLKRFNGVILPDFSLYRDMPLAMQIWNIYRSRAIGHWLNINGVEVIANIRFGDERTVETACSGVQSHGVIAIGTLGVMKRLEDRFVFLKGLEKVVQLLSPTDIVIYGTAPMTYFKKYLDAGIKLHVFESETSKSRKSEED